jgi:hypothetical protein
VLVIFGNTVGAMLGQSTKSCLALHRAVEVAIAGSGDGGGLSKSSVALGGEVGRRRGGEGASGTISTSDMASISR